MAIGERCYVILEFVVAKHHSDFCLPSCHLAVVNPILFLEVSQVDRSEE